jgi:hypothetical protein
MIAVQCLRFVSRGVSMPISSHETTEWSETGQIEIIGRLAEIGRVLQLPDAEVLLASTNVHELNAFCVRYNQSRKWVAFGCLDEMIADRHRRSS